MLTFRKYIKPAIALVIIIAAVFGGYRLIRHHSASSNGLLFSAADISSHDTVLTLGIISADEIIPIIAANGGIEVSKDSAAAKKGLHLAIRVFDSRENLIKAFSEGSVHIAALPVSLFASSWKNLSKKTPVAFLYTGPSVSVPALYAKRETTGAEQLTGKTIACAENSPQESLARFFIAASGAGEMRIITTKNDDETRSLYMSGKAEIAALDTGRSTAPEGSFPLITGADTIPFASTVLTARESDIALRNSLYTKLTALHFEGRKLIASKKDADARQFTASLGSKYDKALHPSSVLPGEQENAVFFRLTKARRWDYFSQFMSGLDDATRKDGGILPGETVNTLLLMKSIPPESIQPDSTAALEISKRAKQLVLSAKSFAYTKDNSAVGHESRHLFQEYAQLANVFPTALISISLFGDAPEERSFAYQREMAVKSILTQLYSVHPSRIVIGKDKGPSISLILPASSK